MFTALLIGIITGYILSAPPLGPTNFAVMSKGFRNEIPEGVAIGIGAGFTDMFYILIAFGGVSLVKVFIPDSVNLFIESNEFYFKSGFTFFGCFIVIIYGFLLMKRKPFEENKSLAEEVEEKEEEAEITLEKKERDLEKLLNKDPFKKKKSSALYTGFFTGVLLCFSSVTLPASWIAIVTYLKGLGVLESNFFAGLFLAIGVLLGTALWFYTLVNIISKNAHRIKPATLNKLNFSVGVLLVLLGIFLFYQAIVLLKG